MDSPPGPIGNASPFITPLPRPTSTRIRSALIIPTFPQILSELVQNSLDARATSIDIRISLVKGSESIRVEDDGCGIPVEDLTKVAQRFLTSKSNVEGYAGFGSRGEALASIASLGMLEIYTKPPGSSDTYAKVVRGDNVLFQGPTSRTSITKGTTVVVKDIFHNIPVRQAALSSQSSSAIVASCRREVETLALAHPSVAWNMWEEPEIGSSASVKRILSIGRSVSSLETFRAIHGRALVERVQKARVSSGDMKAEGFISLDGAMSRAHQYLYLNGVPLHRGELHSAIAKRFTKSRFSSMCQDEPQAPATTRSRQSPRLIEKHPIYVINVSLPAQDARKYIQQGPVSIGSQDLLQKFLLAVFDEFLKRHGFLIQYDAVSVDNTSPTRQKMPAAGQPLMNRTPSGACLGSSIHRVVGEQTIGIASDENAIAPNTGRARKRACYDVTPSGTERRAKKMLEILDGAQSRGLSSQMNTPSCQSCVQSCTNTGQPEQGLLVPRCSREGQFRLGSLSASFKKESLKTAHVLGQVDSKYICCLLETAAQQTAVCLIDQHAADERVLVDALLNELCDGFISNAATTTVLDPPLGIVLTRTEASALRARATSAILERWGIYLAPPPAKETATDYVQIEVTAIPAALPRLDCPDAQELTRLIRLYLPTIEGHEGELQTLLSDLDEGIAVDRGRVLRWMPKEMLDLANSKACRSAVMFEDTLSRDQCARLVAQLAETDHPFICAHGRPSISPLVLLPKAETTRSSKRMIYWPVWGESRRPS